MRCTASIRRDLLSWYDAARRPLPWRRGRNSYRVWVAEVMLQQTRVEVVKRAYARFLRSFPSLARLAAATEDEVLAQWSGLGYYSRARALHRAAVALVNSGQTRFPADYDAARALPGVGEYTAAAVLSIAYQRPYAAVDGNVIRVLSRLGCLSRPDPGGSPHRLLAEELLDRSRPGDWNQAVMELGETICLPKSPRCGECPLGRHCRALARERVHLHPPPKPRRTPERIHLTMTVVRDRSGRLLLERGAFDYLPHMWLPPIAITESNGDGKRADFRHAIQHREFRVKVRSQLVSAAALSRRTRSRRSERRVFRPTDINRIGRSSLLTKALQHLA